MTRNQGYQLIYLTFDSEDYSSGQTWYGPAQKMIHFMPYRYTPMGEIVENLLCLGTISDFGFWNKIGCWETLWSETVDINDRESQLKNEFSDLLNFMETQWGKNTILSTLAHNRMIMQLYAKRLDRWNSLNKQYFGNSRKDPETIREILSYWPSTGPDVYINENIDFSSVYTMVYSTEYKQIEKELFVSKNSDEEKLMYIALLIKESFEIESTYLRTIRDAYKSLASDYSFNNYEKWGKEDVGIENFIEELINRVNAIESTTNLIPDIKKHLESNTPILTNINENTVSNASTLSKIQKHIENPAPKLYALAIEHGLFEKGDEKDPRYRIMGKVRTTLEQWLKILRENGFEQRELPTGASIKGKLRRKVSYNSDPQKENELIIKALNEVKSKKIGNS